MVQTNKSRRKYRNKIEIIFQVLYIQTMSLFVHFDNQTILWKTIQQHPNIHTIPTTEQSSWFKYHIQTVYEKIPTAKFLTPISTEELNELNKNTIRQMIQDLIPRETERVAEVDVTKFPVNTIRRDQVNSTSNIHDRFKEKQQEMESLLQVQPPSKVEFKISEIDEPITNMEELIQQQLRQRELDMMPKMLPDAYASLPPVIQSTEKTTDILKHDLVVGDVLSSEQLNVLDFYTSTAGKPEALAEGFSGIIRKDDVGVLVHDEPISVSKKRITNPNENPQTPQVEGIKTIFDYISRLESLESRVDSLECIFNQYEERIKMLEYISEQLEPKVPISDIL